MEQVTIVICVQHVISVEHSAVLSMFENVKMQDCVPPGVNNVWNVGHRLIQRLHAATGVNAPNTTREADIFMSYCPRNSEAATSYGVSPGYFTDRYTDGMQT
jgi:hypothetical protein